MKGLPAATGASRIFVAIPLLAVASIGTLVLWVGAPRPVLSARLWGGPTDRLARFTGLIELERQGDLRVPRSGATVQVSARAESGATAQTVARLDPDGQAEITLDFGRRAPGSFQISLQEAGRVVAEGRVQLTGAEWAAKASVRGGYFPVASRGSAALRAAPARGTFAVPFASSLWIRAESAAGRPWPGARLELSSSGARVEPTSLVTDARGFGFASLTPLEHGVTLTVRASGSTDGAELTASVPVVPGALMAERRDRVLVLRSPIARSEAFVTVVSEAGRLLGARVPLQADAQGMASGSLDLPAELPAKTWAVVESVRGAPSAERVGWPLFDPRGEPAVTFDARDALLLDGFPHARAQERDRQRTVRRIAVGIGLAGALFSAFSVILNARRQGRRLTAHLEAQLTLEGESSIGLAKPSRSGLWLAVALIALGFLLTAAVAAWRLG